MRGWIFGQLGRGRFKKCCKNLYIFYTPESLTAKVVRQRLIFNWTWWSITLPTSAILIPVFYVKYREHIVTLGWSYKDARFYCPLQSRLHHRITFSLQFPATVNLWTFRISFLTEPMQNSKVSSCFPYCRFIWIYLVFTIFG